MVAAQLVQHLFLQCKMYNYSFAFHCHLINYARFCLIGQYPPKLGSNLSFFLGPCVYSISSSVSSLNAGLMSSINMQTGMSTVVPIVCMFMLIHVISCYLSSVCCDKTANLQYIGLDQVCIVCAC